MMECPNCKTPAGAPGWKARTTYLWANQHGYSVRLFCSVCGQWTDFRDTYEWGSVPKVVRVVQQPREVKD